jgi:hypothetical protein
MRILLTGGAGFIGSHVAEALLERGHEVAIIDDLSSGKRENVPEGPSHSRRTSGRGAPTSSRNSNPRRSRTRRPRRTSGARSGSRISTRTSTSWAPCACWRTASATVWARSSSLPPAGRSTGSSRNFRPPRTTRSTPSLHTGSPSWLGSATSTTTTRSTGSLMSRFATLTSTAPPGPARGGRGGGDLRREPGCG